MHLNMNTTELHAQDEVLHLGCCLRWHRVARAVDLVDQLKTDAHGSPWRICGNLARHHRLTLAFGTHQPVNDRSVPNDTPFKFQPAGRLQCQPKYSDYGRRGTSSAAE